MQVMKRVGIFDWLKFPTMIDASGRRDIVVRVKVEEIVSQLSTNLQLTKLKSRFESSTHYRFSPLIAPGHLPASIRLDL